jgi:Na+/H+ antiporter NhaC
MWMWAHIMTSSFPFNPCGGDKSTTIITMRPTADQIDDELRIKSTMRKARDSLAYISYEI